MEKLTVTLEEIKFGTAQREEANAYGRSVPFKAATGKFTVSGRFDQDDVVVPITVEIGEDGEEGAVKLLRAGLHDFCLALVEASESWVAAKP